MSGSAHVQTAIDSTSTMRGNVGSVEYRDRLHGTMFTAHFDVVAGYGWIVEHAPTDRADTDGTPVRWSGAIPDGFEGLNRVWSAVRAGE